MEKGKNNLNNVMQLLIQQGEQKVKAYNDRVSDIWKQIHDETGIDLQNVIWVPHPEKNEVIPVQLKLLEGLPSQEPLG